MALARSRIKMSELKNMKGAVDSIKKILMADKFDFTLLQSIVQQFGEYKKSNTKLILSKVQYDYLVSQVGKEAADKIAIKARYNG